MYLEVFQVLLLASPPPEGNAVWPKKLGRIYLGETKERRKSLVTCVWAIESSIAFKTGDVRMVYGNF